MPLFPSIFCTIIAVFSLYGEYAVRSFLPNGVFLLCDHGLDYWFQLRYAQNPVFEIVREENVKVYLHMYNGNVQRNSLRVESCAIEDFSISPRFSPTMFDPDANSVLGLINVFYFS